MNISNSSDPEHRKDTDLPAEKAESKGSLPGTVDNHSNVDQDVRSDVGKKGYWVLIEEKFSEEGKRNIRDAYAKYGQSSSSRPQTASPQFVSPQSNAPSVDEEEEPAPEAPVASRLSSYFAAALFLIFISFIFYYLMKKDLTIVGEEDSDPSSKKAAEVKNDLNVRYSIIATLPDKVFFYDQQREAISEVKITSSAGMDKGIQRGESEFIPSVDLLIPNPIAKKIAVIANRQAYRNGIYVVDITQTDESGKFMACWTQRLPAGYSVKSVSIASWSPDGSALAFVACKDSNQDLFIAYSDVELNQVTYLGKSIGAISWLDKERIAFISDWRGSVQIYTVRKDGGDLKKIPW
jgi:hypothetical protein